MSLTSCRWEAWFTLACLGTFRSLKIICSLHGIGFFGDIIFSAAFRIPGLGNHLVLILFEAKEMEWKPLLDTDWATWVYDYGSVSPCYLLAGRLGASRLTSLRFSVPGYNSTPLLVLLKIKGYNPCKALGQSLAGSKSCLSPSFFSPPSSYCLDLWWPPQTGGRSDLSWKGKGGWEHTQKLVKDTSYPMGCF